MELPTLILRKDQERRILAGHAWIYSNEIDTKRSPLKAFKSGEAVAICTQKGKWLANGYINPQSLICARVVSRSAKKHLDRELLMERIQHALELRNRLYTEPYYRLVFGESDLLPGLTIDRFGDYLSIQITTAGMELVRDEMLSVVGELLNPKGVILRNDVAIREQEGLEQSIETVVGEVPGLIEISEGESCFLVDLHKGQKTGWFYDQAANRDQLKGFVNDKTVLDICSYAGAWSIRSAMLGARYVTAVDVSSAALSQVMKNAEHNGVTDRITAIEGDAFDVMKSLIAEQQQYDVVNLDPPAFIKRKKDMKAGTDAYRHLNQLGLELLKPGGFLISSSCSFHFSREQLQNVIRQAAIKNRHDVQILAYGQQGPDHPIHPAIVETAYLKTLFLHKMKR